MGLQNSKVFSKMMELGKTCLNEDENMEQGMKMGGLRAHFVPEPAPKLLANNNSLVLIGNKNKIFEELIKLISKEKEAEHLSKREIEDSIWKFLFFIFNDNTDEKIIKQEAKQIIKSLLKPHVLWYVVSPLNQVKCTFEIIFNEDNFIKEIKEEDFEKYFFNGERSRKYFDDEFLSNTAIFVTVSANNSESALKKGKEKINDFLDTLQFTFGDDYFHSIEKPNVFTSIHKLNHSGKHHWLQQKNQFV